MKRNLPNFLIVGAAKSGTSSLHNYLNQHPEVFMPSYNEMGMKVKMVEVDDVTHAVDFPEDVKIVEELLNGN